MKKERYKLLLFFIKLYKYIKFEYIYLLASLTQAVTKLLVRTICSTSALLADDGTSTLFFFNTFFITATVTSSNLEPLDLGASVVVDELVVEVLFLAFLGYRLR